MNDFVPLRILFLEDQAIDADLAIDHLHQEGFAVEWQRVETEEAYLAHLDASWDIILADYNLSHFNGLQALKHLQIREIDIPLILISGTIGEELAVEIMRHGATDYIFKDRLGRLGAAVKSALRERHLREEKRKMECALRDSEERFRVVIEQGNAITAIIGGDGKIGYISPSLEFVLGYKPEEFTGKSLLDLAYREDIQEVKETFARILQSAVSVTYTELRVRNKAGDLRTLELVVTNMLDTVGVRGIVLNAHDITERKQAEREIYESQRFLRSTLDALSKHIAILDEMGTIVTVNAAWRIFADANVLRDPTYGIGSNYLAICDSVVGDGADDAARMAAGIRSLLTGECETFSLEYTCHSPTEQRWFEVKATRFRDSGPVHVVMSHNNITEHKQMEAALRTTEKYFRATFEQAAVGIAHVGVQGPLLRVNQKVCDILGYTESELLALPFQNVIQPSDIAGLEALMLNDLQTFTHEQQYSRKDGSSVWCNLTVSLIHTFSGEADYFLCVVEDISQRKQAELKAYENAEHLRVSLSGVDIAVFNQDLDLRYTWMYQPQAGYTVEQVIGKTDRELLPPEMAEILSQMKQRVIETNQADHQEMGGIENGEMKFYDLSIEPLRDAAGLVIGITGASLNVTARKQADEQARFQAHLLNTVGQAVIATNLDGEIIYWNRFAETLYGWSSAEVLGRNVLDVTPNADTYDHSPEITAHLTRGESWSGEIVMRRRDGTAFPAQIRITPVYDSAGKLVSSIGISIDITQRKQVEDQLHFQANLLNTVGQAVIATDPERIITYWNRFAETLYGWTAEEALGRGIADTIMSEATAAQDIEIADALQKGENWTGEYTVQHRDAVSFPIQITITPVYNHQGQSIGIITTSTDITERKKAEESLHKLSMAIEQTTDPIVISDTNGMIEYVNSAFEAQTGIPRSEAIGRQPYNLRLGDHSIEFYETIAKTVLADNMFHSVMANQRRTGEAYYEDTTVSPIKNAAGMITHFVTTGRDITARIELEKAEREQRMFAEALRDTASALIDTLEREAVMTRILQNVERIGSHTGATILLIEDEQAIFSHWDNFLPDTAAALGEVHLPVSSPFIQKLLSDLKAVVISDFAEYPVWNSYPQLAWIQSLASAPIITQGVLFGFLILVSGEKNFFDMVYAERLKAFADQAALALEKALIYTELRSHAEELEERVNLRTAELQIALEKERELSDMKSRFASMASHEIRTPLAIIQVSVDSLQHYWEKMIPTDRTMRFNRVTEQIRRITALLADVLTINRSDSGTLEFHPIALDLNGLCLDILDQLRQTASLHELLFETGSDVILIHGDQKLLQEAITNLITNAIKYSPPNSQVIIRLTQDKTHVSINVQDQGIGIPQKDQKYLFEPFHRSSNVGSIQGTGLGLAIVKRAIDLHGGRITLDTQIDVGSTFTIILPIRQTAEIS